MGTSLPPTSWCCTETSTSARSSWRSTPTDASPRCWSTKAIGSAKVSCWPRSTPRGCSSAVAEAQARVAAQREVVARLEAGSRPEEIRKARADAEAARVDVKNAELQYQRQQELVAKHYVSQQQVDNARFGLEAAQARLKAIEEALRLAELGPRVEDKRGGEGDAGGQRGGARYRPARPRGGHARGALGRRDRESHPGAGRHGLACRSRCSLWRSPIRYGCGPTCPRRTSASSGSAAAPRSRPTAIPTRATRGWVGFISPTAEFTPKSVETQEVRTTLVYQVRVFVCNAAKRTAPGHAGDRAHSA